MLKYFSFLTICILFVNTAKSSSKSADTAIMFFKTINGFGQSVHTLDEADYFMLIIPPDSTDDRYNIQGFYKNGKLKFVGKGDPSANSLKTGSVLLDGDYISYYPNGKRASTAHYQKGYKDGLEYFYYANGKMYSCHKHILGSTILRDQALYWECYDADGNQICNNGNGRWITYDDSCKSIKLEGQVVKGRMEGEWKGVVSTPVPIKYSYQYKEGNILSSVGYDQTGKAYPFKNEIERAAYRSGAITFIDVLRSNIKLPRDSAGKKMSIDTVHISFVIEKDGHLDEFNVMGNVAPQLKEAIFAGLLKCHDWTPERIFGIPFRTQIVLPLNEISGYTSNSSRSAYRKEVFYKEKIIKDN